MKKRTYAILTGALLLTVSMKPNFVYAEPDSTQMTETQAQQETGPAEVQEGSTDVATSDTVLRVINQIDQIGKLSEMTLADETTVKQARTAYEALGMEEKQQVTNLDKLQKAEERIKTLKDTSVYSYSFSLSDKLSQTVLTVGYATDTDGDEKADEPVLTLESPDGKAYELSSGDTQVKGIGFTADIGRTENKVMIDITSGKIGNWILTSSYPISFSAEGYQKDGDSENTESSTEKEGKTEETADTKNQTSGQKKKSFNSYLKNPTEFYILLVLGAAVLAFAIVMKIRVRRLGKNDPQKKKPEKASGKKAGKKKNSEEREEEAAVRDTEQELQDFWSQYQDDFSKNMEQEKIPEPEDKTEEKKEIEEVFITQEDIDNDETIEEYVEHEDGSMTKREPEKKEEKKNNFFPEDRFGF